MRKYLAPLVIALLAVTGTAAPGQAATGSFPDAARDSRTRGMDILQVEVRNADHKVVVTTIHRNLRKKTIGGVTLWIDTDPDRNGPERQIARTTTGGDSDYYVFRVRNWKPKGDPLTCPAKTGVDYKNEEVHFNLGGKCFKARDAVRVNVVATYQNPETNKRRNDHAPSRHHFYAKVAKG